MQPGSPLQAGAWARTLRSCAFRALAGSHLYESVIEPQIWPLTFVTEIKNAVCRRGLSQT